MEEEEEDGDSLPRAAVTPPPSGRADILTPLAGEETLARAVIAGEKNLARAFAGENKLAGGNNLAGAFAGEKNRATAFAGDVTLAGAFGGEKNLATAFAGEQTLASSYAGEKNLATAFAGEECRTLAAGEEKLVRAFAGEECSSSVAGDNAGEECSSSVAGDNAGEECRRSGAGDNAGEAEVKRTIRSFSGGSRNDRMSKSTHFAGDDGGGGGGGSCIWRMLAADGGGVNAGGGGGEEEEAEEEGIYCIDHPYRRNPGGICAFCLEEKLSKLLLSSSSSSSKFNATFPLHVAPPYYASPPSLSAVRSTSHASSTSNGGSSGKRIPRMPSILKKGDTRFQRSRSSAISTQRFLLKRSFWSFLHISRASPANNNPPAAAAEAQTPAREVRRCRSVGCGSRSFSGDIFDCALRRERDGGRSAAAEAAVVGERVRCGGRIFASLSSSSSSSSSLSSGWIAPPYAADGRRRNSRSAVDGGGGGRGWVWALASPIRVLSRSRTAGPTGKSKPDLKAVPSLLTSSVGLI